MSAKFPDVVLGVHSKQFHRDGPRHRKSWCSEYDANNPFLPPKHPGIHRSSDIKQSKTVAFCETGSADTHSSYDDRNANPRNSWSCESDANDQFLVPPKFSETLRSPKAITQDTWGTHQCRQSSGNSTSCESDSKEEIQAKSKFPGVHRSSKTKQSRRVSWEIDLINDVKSALNDLQTDHASPRNPRRDFDSKREVFINDEFPVMHRSPNLKNRNHANCWDSDRCSQSSRNSEEYASNSKEVILAPPINSSNRHFSEFPNCKKLIPKEAGVRRTLSDDDIRKIINGILEELRPPRSERSISCSSCCSGCCSSCCSCSNFGSWSPRPSTPAVDIPKIRQNPAFLARIHGNPPRIESPRESTCSCTPCTTFKNPVSPPSILSPSSWMTNSFCSHCLPPFDKDSLDSKISSDSLNPQSIFSLDSLNSLTDPDSLEYSKTNVSIDSLDSLDSCCYDSLSDSKDSGFFSCSLPVVC